MTYWLSEALSLTTLGSWNQISAGFNTVDQENKGRLDQNSTLVLWISFLCYLICIQTTFNWLVWKNEVAEENMQNSVKPGRSKMWMTKKLWRKPAHLCKWSMRPKISGVRTPCFLLGQSFSVYTCVSWRCSAVEGTYPDCPSTAEPHCLHTPPALPFRTRTSCRVCYVLFLFLPARSFFVQSMGFSCHSLMTTSSRVRCCWG